MINRILENQEVKGYSLVSFIVGAKLHELGFIPKYMSNEGLYFKETKELNETLEKLGA